MGWTIVGGPREFRAPAGGDRSAGWTWDIEERGIRRVINAEVTEQAAGLYTLEDAEAAVREVLAEADPPVRLTLSSVGIVRG